MRRKTVGEVTTANATLDTGAQAGDAPRPTEGRLLTMSRQLGQAEPFETPVVVDAPTGFVPLEEIVYEL